MHASAQPFRRAAAICILLAVLVSPLCASICGSRGCGHGASPQSDDCHSSLAASSGASTTLIAAIRLCALQELSAADVSEIKISTHDAKPGRAVLPSDLFATQFHTSAVSALLPATANKIAFENNLESLTILRI